MYEKPLSNLYQLYIKGNLKKKELEGEIFRYLLENHKKYYTFRGSAEDWQEFLSWLYPRLSRAVDLYRELGSSLDAYISTLIHCAAREYRLRETDHKITELVFWKVKAEETSFYESEPEYSENKENILIPRNIKPKYIMLLLLKYYYTVSDEMLKQAAGMIGMNEEKLRNMIEEIHKRRHEKEADIMEQRERVYLQHYRCLTYQKRMDITSPGSGYHERMKERLERARIRFNTMRKRLVRMRVTASNRMISDVTGIPKGTIDSGFYAMKNYLARRNGRDILLNPMEEIPKKRL